MASRVGPKQKTLTFKDGNISIGPSLTVSIIIGQNIHLPTAPAVHVFFFLFLELKILPLEIEFIDRH